MNKTALFAGSFDPFTLGHLDIVKRGVNLFDKVVIGIGVNSSKSSFYSMDEKVAIIKASLQGIENYEIKEFTGLTVDFCAKNDIKFLLRGVRNSSDLEYESTIAALNFDLNDDIETVILNTRPHLSHISSTIVREVLVNKGDISKFISKDALQIVNRAAGI